MTGSGPQLAGPGLLGREPECAAVGRLLEDARAGTGGALVVRGEAGIGKSALLDFARQRAAPMAVLSATGVEAESDLAFAGLHELLRPILDHLGELPDIQRKVGGSTPPTDLRHPSTNRVMHLHAPLPQKDHLLEC